MSDLIYLGYDPLVQGAVAMHDGTVLCIPDDQDSSRQSEVINGLLAVSTRVSQDATVGEGNITVIIRSPWSHTVEYSDQAWRDLCEIAD